MILRKCFTVPSYGIGRLSNSPGSTAVTLIVKRAVIWPAGLLRRRMKTDVSDVDTWPQWHTKRLDSSVQVLVIQGILIVPDSGSWIGHFVSYEPEAVIARIRFELVQCRACPCHEGRSPPDRGTKRRKCEARCAGDVELAIRNVVVHIAFPGIRLAPRVLVGSDILRFGEVRRALIQVLVQIIDFNPDPMRYTVVRMAAVVVRGRRKSAGERIDPGARTDAALAAIQAGGVRI